MSADPERRGHRPDLLVILGPKQKDCFRTPIRRDARCKLPWRLRSRATPCTVRLAPSSRDRNSRSARCRGCSSRAGIPSASAQVSGGPDLGSSITTRRRTLTDPVIDRPGRPVDDAYVETYWLPILGPSMLRPQPSLRPHDRAFNLLIGRARMRGCCSGLRTALQNDAFWAGSREQAVLPVGLRWMHRPKGLRHD
jgi:hypothetical protein